jgi:hypothetical protein
VRYRFIFTIWILGALVAGMALGEILERDLYSGNALVPVRRHSPTIATDSGKENDSATNLFSRC